MSYEETILSVTAIVATITFLWSVVRQRQRDKEADLRAWQSAAVQSFFEQCGPIGAELNEVLQWYRTDAMARFPGGSKSELSELACRRGLMDLVDRDVIEQIDSSRYRLSTVDTAGDVLSDMMKPMMGSATPIRGDKKVQKAIHSVVAAKTFSRTLDAAIVEVSEKTGALAASVRTVLAFEVGKPRLQTNEQNMLGVCPMTAIGS